MEVLGVSIHDDAKQVAKQNIAHTNIIILSLSYTHTHTHTHTSKSYPFVKVTLGHKTTWPLGI